MKIKTGFEIISDFLGRGHYNLIYLDTNFPLPIKEYGYKPPLSKDDAITVMLSSAVSGGNVIGFFNSDIRLHNFVELRGLAIFVTTELPSDPTVPIIFCRDIKDLPKRYELAVSVSEEFRIPVFLCVNANAIFNFLEIDNINLTTERVAPYISPEIFKKLKVHYDQSKYNAINDFLQNRLSPNFEGNGTISFRKADGKFLRFFVPFTTKIDFNLEQELIDKPELYFWKNIQKGKLFHFSSSVSIDGEKRVLRDIFCPGCPILMISKNIPFNDRILVTDIHCPTIFRYFGFKKQSLKDVVGMVMHDNQKKVFFVGRLSALDQGIFNNIKNLNYIFLNDGVKNIFSIPVISRPYKFKDLNTVFPYSCNNIPKIGNYKINTKKCVCFHKNESPHCVRGSHCPAIYEYNGAVSINEKFCNGCRLCYMSCPYGAIK
ncbi:MAG: 4Fe-4S binding protein, partial [Calditerrivibrio sp.]|nr:4Fe-4S binding protein [Calditerrivibrio sp.]